MKLVIDYVRELIQATRAGWNRFWFTPTDPATLGLIRILAGAMLFYTHLIWSLDLEGFFGYQGRLSPEYVNRFHESPFAWSYLNWIQSTSLLWAAHIAALAILAMFTLGVASRATSILAFVITVSYANRAPGALFGLDQINGLLAMYLMVGPCGAAYSLDRVFAKFRCQGRAPPRRPAVTANIAVRLIQLHMCVVYLFAGIGKLLGETWWDGTALWGVVANFEYQSVDVTWLAGWPLTINAMTHVTVAWEISYCVMVWPRLTRPIVVCVAIPLHLGIVVCMGMITFGLAMLIGNLAFVSPEIVRRLLDRRSK